MECHADFSAESSSTYQDSAGPSHQSVSLANVSQLLDSKWRGEEVAAVQVIHVINSLVSVAWAGGARWASPLYRLIISHFIFLGLSVQPRSAGKNSMSPSFPPTFRFIYPTTIESLSTLSVLCPMPDLTEPSIWHDLCNPPRAPKCSDRGVEQAFSVLAPHSGGVLIDFHRSYS